MNIMDRKIINLFKSFIQKVFVPQLPKMDGNCQKQWNKFSSMISMQQINVNQIQSYVQSLSANIASFGVQNNFNINAPKNNNFFTNSISSGSSGFNKQSAERTQNKSPLFTKLRKDSINDNSGSSSGTGFNPSRTFGGERAKMMFQVNDSEQVGSKNGITTQSVMPTLQRLFKTFTQNQNKLQKIGPSNLPITYQHKNFYN